LFGFFSEFDFTGPDGDNGKSTISEILKGMLGSDYAYKSSVKLLLGQKDQVSLTNYHKKRFIYFEEPTITKRLQSAFIKDITGGDELPARGLYTTKTSNVIHATFCLNTNYEPEFTEAGKAMQKRIIISNWDSKFVDDIELVDKSKNIYLADKNVGKPHWIKKYGSTIFHILCENYQKYIKDGETFKLSNKQKENKENVLRISDGFKIWFDSITTKTDDKKDFITFEELGRKLSCSEYWTLKNKNQKTMGALEYFKKSIKNYSDIIECYKKEKNLGRKNGKQQKIYGGILIKHQFKDDFESNYNKNNYMEIDSENDQQSQNYNENVNMMNSSEKKKNRKRKLKSKSISPLCDSPSEPPKKRRKISK